MQTFVTELVVVVALFAGCSKDSKDASKGDPPKVASGGAQLTVDGFCKPFCTKLCGTCGVGDCMNTCTPRCYYGRAPDSLMDGKDPKVALALTQKELDGCLATITADSCKAIAAGQVPPACFTIQH